MATQRSRAFQTGMVLLAGFLAACQTPAQRGATTLSLLGGLWGANAFNYAAQGNVRAANAAAALGNIGTELGRQQAATAAAEAGKAQVNVNVNSGTSSETPRSVPAGRSDLDVGSDRYNAGDFMGAYAKWRDASDQGDTRAMRSIGWLYEKGQGVQQNYAEAMRWFRKAADGGDVDAMYRLGNCYADGHGVQQDLAEAKRWWSKAAEGGSTKAKERLKELQ